MTMVQTRIKNLEYAVEHYEDVFYIITNSDGATNFKIVKTKIENLIDIIPHHGDVLLEDFEVLLKNYLVIEEREKGRLQIKIIDDKIQESYYLHFSDASYTAYITMIIWMIQRFYDTTTPR